ncbi:hypothetical protein FRX31_015950 [Thalictrum thalictroides]|uniref:Uncharacterized protein n=1 Tax=Thalictrum thalictroides TaxID=46969 RepID=A0A7J6WBY1_THATH|nr:hypothetical protein FRX31_015950 [Thalictrum thalictroides]
MELSVVAVPWRSLVRHSSNTSSVRYVISLTSSNQTLTPLLMFCFSSASSSTALRISKVFLRLLISSSTPNNSLTSCSACCKPNETNCSKTVETSTSAMFFC